jgi:hypothetical protein
MMKNLFAFRTKLRLLALFGRLSEQLVAEKVKSINVQLESQNANPE